MKIKLINPLISCICITKNRTDKLLKTIIAFDQQYYPNKELVISYPKTDHETKKLILQILEITPIRILPIEREEDESIGKARNNAIAISGGEYICMWDDDDIHHEMRLSDQHNVMLAQGRSYQASLLKNIHLYDALTDKTYQSFSTDWYGTLFCKREHILRHPCSDSNQYEILPVIDYLKFSKLLFEMFNAPYYYVYVYHGTNIISYSDFQQLTAHSTTADQDKIRNLKMYLEQKVSLNPI